MANEVKARLNRADVAGIGSAGKRRAAVIADVLRYMTREKVTDDSAT